MVQPVHSLCWQEDTTMHGLLGTVRTQASSFGCISPEGLSCCHGVRGALPAPRHQSIAWCSLFGLTGGQGTHRCMTYVGSTDCTQASLCGCTRSERANVAFSCVCDALPAPKQQSVAWCSLFTLSVGKRTRRCMACLAQIAHRHRRLGTLAPKA